MKRGVTDYKSAPWMEPGHGLQIRAIDGTGGHGLQIRAMDGTGGHGLQIRAIDERVTFAIKKDFLSKKIYL